MLVTGGTGYLGSAIVGALVRRGHDPVVFARRASASALPGRLIDGDVRDRPALARAARDVDAICHTAALVSVWRRRAAEFDEVNVGGLESAIAACRQHAIPRLVYTSSFLAFRPPEAPPAACADNYQRTKTIARETARRAADDGLPIVSLFPGVVYGPGNATEGNLFGRLLTQHLAGRLPGIVGADRRWSYAFVDDVADAHVTAIERGRAGAEYSLGGENAPQMRVFEIVRAATGVALPRRIPFAVASAAGFFAEARARLTGATPLLTRGTVGILRQDWPMDSRRSEQELGYRITPLSEGLAATLESLR